MDVADRQKQWMIDAGFVDVYDDIYKVPLDRWPRDPRLKKIGLYFQAQSIDAIEPVSMALFTRALHFTPEQAQVMMAGPRAGMRNSELHLYLRFHFVYGRKPLLDEGR